MFWEELWNWVRGNGWTKNPEKPDDWWNREVGSNCGTTSPIYCTPDDEEEPNVITITTLRQAGPGSLSMYYLLPLAKTAEHEPTGSVNLLAKTLDPNSEVKSGDVTSVAMSLPILKPLKYIGPGSRLVIKLLKFGKGGKLPTPNLNPEQFVQQGFKFIHKKSGAIYSKSFTSHGNPGNIGTQWKVWPKGTTNFGKTSKTTGTRITIDGSGNVIGN